jgi:4-hydroxy-3-polyprenylbenzoate decarboxylase
LADDYPVFHVTAVTHRKNPIYQTIVVGPPPQEDAYLGKATERIFMPLIKLTFPEIKDMHLPIETCFHNLAIVSIKKQYPGHAKKIMHSFWGTGQLMFTKCLIVVDEDVNVQNLAEVAWRVSNNIDAKRDIIFAEGPVDALDHAAEQFRVRFQDGHRRDEEVEGRRLQPEWPEVARMSPEVKKRVDEMREIWNKLGI